MQTAYTLATNSKTAKKGKRKVPKGKGQRAVQGSKALSPATMVEIDHSHFRIAFLISLTRLTSNSFTPKLSSWGNDPFSSAKTYVPERPRSQHVWTLRMLKSATTALMVTFFAVVHFGGSVRLHTKKLRKNCPLARNALTWRFWHEMGMIMSPPPVEGR